MCSIPSVLSTFVVFVFPFRQMMSLVSSSPSPPDCTEVQLREAKYFPKDTQLVRDGAGVGTDAGP